MIKTTESPETARNISKVAPKNGERRTIQNRSEESLSYNSEMEQLSKDVKKNSGNRGSCPAPTVEEKAASQHFTLRGFPRLRIISFT